MAPRDLRRLVPGAPQSLLKILDGRLGPVQPPIRSEIFGLQRFAQHGRSLGETHRAARARAREATFFPPLAGLPRVYGIAWAFVAHTDGAFDEALLVQFLSAYQETRELNLSEIWALP